MTDYGICGLVVRSAIELPYPVRQVSHDHDVTIERGLVVEPAGGDGTSPARFGVEDGGIVLTVRGLGRMLARAGRVVTVDVERGAALEDVQLYLVGAMLGAIWQQRGVFPLHASAVRIGDSAVAIAGRTGAGKSTLAAFLCSRGHALVSDDMCVLTTTSSGAMATWPGPARMKLAIDGLRQLGHDSARLGSAGGTRGKFHLPVKAVPLDEPVRLAGLYVLTEGEGEPRIDRLTGLDAVDAVAGHTYSPEFAQALGVEADWLRSCVKTAGILPIHRLVRPLGYRHMERVLDLLEAEGTRV